MIFTALAAVSFIDQHDHVGAVIAAIGKFAGAGELIDNGEDYPVSAFADPLGQVATGIRFGSTAFFVGERRSKGSGSQKVAGQLLFEISPIGNNDDSAFGKIRMEQQCLAEQHHSEAFA